MAGKNLEGLGNVHGTASPQSDQAVTAVVHVALDALFAVLLQRVGMNFAENGAGQLARVESILKTGCEADFQDGLVGNDQCLPVPLLLNGGRHLIQGTLTQDHMGWKTKLVHAGLSADQPSVQQGTRIPSARRTYG